MEFPSNWGRWGEDDERGTLNLVTDEVRARAVAEARTGRSVSLAMPVRPASFALGPFVPELSGAPAVQQAMMYTGSPPMGMAELLLVTTHHADLTHIDALAHIPVDGAVYPGRPLDEAAGPMGVRHGSTTAFSAGVVTRGVLLDLASEGPLPAGHPVTGDDLEAAERRQGAAVQSGDALVVRGGWSPSRDRGAHLPGISLDAVRWMQQRDVSVYLGDIGDAFPPLDAAAPMPLHLVGLARLGMPLVDVAEVDELAATCAELGRHQFMLVIAPMRVEGATGVPVNPLAVF